MSILEISTDNIVDGGQIGWIKYQEGDAILNVKVIRTSRGTEPFLSHVTAYRQGTTVRTVEYVDTLTWNQRAKHMLAEFRRVMGDEYYYRSRNTLAPVRR